MIGEFNVNESESILRWVSSYFMIISRHKAENSKFYNKLTVYFSTCHR